MRAHGRLLISTIIPGADATTCQLYGTVTTPVTAALLPSASAQCCLLLVLRVLLHLLTLLVLVSLLRLTALLLT
jgi:hypothetical protein